MPIISKLKILLATLLLGFMILLGGHTAFAKDKNNETTKSKDELSIKKPNLSGDQQRQWFRMVGKSYIDQPLENGGSREILSRRFIDGTYEIIFRSYDKNGNYTDSIEVGEWGISNGIYFTIFKGWVKDGQLKRADARDPYNRDVYKIITLNDDVFIYETLDGKTRFSAKHVADDFVLKERLSS